MLSSINKWKNELIKIKVENSYITNSNTLNHLTYFIAVYSANNNTWVLQSLKTYVQLVLLKGKT